MQCDPSHRRSHNDMSRASTSTTNTYSPGRSDPSPTVSVPSLSPEPTQSSQSSMPSFDASNAIDDFVLFPEDTSSWNPADLPVAEDYDLSNFNFDINELTDFPQAGADQSFNFSSFDQLASNFPLVGQQQYTSSQPQNSIDYWKDPQLLIPVAHTRPHPTTTLMVSGQLDSTGWLQDVTTVSPRSSTNAAYGDHYWPDARDQVQTSPVAVMNDSPSSFSSADWSVLELSINANISPQPDVSASPGSSQSSHSSRRSQQVEQAQLLVGTSTSPHVNEGIQEPAEQASLRRLGETGTGTVPSEPQVPEGGSISSLDSLTGGLHEYGQSHISRTTSGIPGEFLGLADTCTLVSESLRAVRSAPTEYIALSGELQRLRTVLVQFHTRMADTTVLERLKTYGTQLQVLRSRVKQIVLSGRLLHEQNNQQDTEYYVDFVRQCQVKARRLVRSLCSIINNLQTQESGSSPTNDDSSPNSGHNLPLFVSSSQAQIHGNHGYSLAPDIQVMDSSILSWQKSSSPSDVSGMDFSLRQGERLDEQDREVAYDLFGIFAPEARSQHANSGFATLGVRDVPRYSLLVKTEAIAADLERLSPQTDINIQESLNANFVRPGDESAQASPSFNDYQQDTTAVHIFEEGSNSGSQSFPAVDYSSSLEDGILWSSRPRQVPLTSPTPIIVNLATTVSQLMDSSEDVAFAQTGGDSSLGAVSQATGEAARLPATNTEQDGIFRHVDIQQANIIATLSIIGLFLTVWNFHLNISDRNTNNLQAPSPIMSSILNYLLPLVVLALFSPRENSMAWPPLPSVNVASIACLAPLARPSLQYILFVREFCTEWTNTNSTFASIAKLVICAIIAAEAPAIFSKVFQSWNGHQIAMAIATSMISFFGDEMSADGSMCKGNKSVSGTELQQNLDLLSRDIRE